MRGAQGMHSDANEEPGVQRVVYTIGHGEAEQEEILARLVDAGVRTLVDIRERAAGKKGFNKTELEAACRAAGIDYVQVRDLGAPLAVRRGHDPEADWAGFQDAYATHLKEQKEAFRTLKETVLAGPAALFCRCAHPARCERGVLATLFARAGYGVRHLDTA
ncbi:MAG: DUF488 domain-containing protein [Euryarchaeota archaeon]|nr:DUF488 domain-containing protein [Euryarchaeota archaeon]